MNRRRFLAAVGSVPFISAHAAQSPRQGTRLPTVGIYSTSPDVKGLKAYYVDHFLARMQELGWSAGSNVEYDEVYNKDGVPRPQYVKPMREYAQALVLRKPDVIWVDSSISAEMILEQTSTIPVVGAAVSEAVRRKWSDSLARPNRNFTGASNPTSEYLGGKRMEALFDMMPKLRRAGFLTLPDPGPATPADEIPSWIREEGGIRAFAKSKGVSLISAVMGQVDQAEAAFARFAKERVEAVLIAHHPVFQNHREDLLKRARELKIPIPIVGTRKYFVEDGALLSVATELRGQMRFSAEYVDKILKGAAIRTLAIEEFKKVEVAINTEVAKAFGLVIPGILMTQAPTLIP